MIYGAKIGGLCPPRSLVSTSDPIGSENVRQFPIGSAVDSTKKTFADIKKSAAYILGLGGSNWIRGRPAGSPPWTVKKVRLCPLRTMSANVRRRQCPPRQSPTMSAKDIVRQRQCPPRTMSRHGQNPPEIFPCNLLI